MITRECGRGGLVAHTPEDLSQYIPPEQWTLFRHAIAAVRDAGLAHALGGGLAISFYTGLWRSTKDLDLYILPASRERTIAALSQVGLEDYYPVAPYDRAWIYRGHREGLIVDVIWALANRIADIDQAWLECGPKVELAGETLPLVAPEELLWSKIHVLQRDRCDWPDLVNLLYTVGPALQWERLLRRLGPEHALLASLLALFTWVAPARAAQLPGWLWPRLGLRAPAGGPALDRHRVDLLDTRPWFTEVAPS
jgi:hypothetical protein